MHKTISFKEFLVFIIIIVINNNVIITYDVYPLYRRRKPKNGGHRFLLKMRNNEN